MVNTTRYRKLLSTHSSILTTIKQRGFTLIEVVWVLMLFMLILTILFSLMLALQGSLKMDQHRSNLIQEGQAFFAYINREIEMADRIYTTNPHEVFIRMTDGSIVRYRKDGNYIVRAVKLNNVLTFSGYTILLQGVKSVSFQNSSNERAVQIDVVTRSGENELMLSNYLSSNLTMNP